MVKYDFHRVLDFMHIMYRSSARNLRRYVTSVMHGREFTGSAHEFAELEKSCCVGFHRGQSELSVGKAVKIASRRYLSSGTSWSAGGDHQISARRANSSEQPHAMRSSVQFHDDDEDVATAEHLLDSLEESIGSKDSTDYALSQRGQDEQQSILLEKVTRAYELARSAASRGSPRAHTILGHLYRDAIGVKHDLEKAEEHLKVGAQAGDPLAQLALGTMMLDILRHEEDDDESANYLVKGLHDALQSRSKLNDKKIVVEMDEKGLPKARYEVEDSNQGVVETPAVLVRRVRKARKKYGFTDQEAREFEEFKQREKSKEASLKRERAISLIREASSSGLLEATIILGNTLMQNDASAALKLYEQAVSRSHVPSAHFNIAQIYRNGSNGVEMDQKLALKHYLMAAQLGDAAAQFYLSNVYRAGELGVNPDLATSLQYVQLAADQQHPAAVYHLALMHRNGEGGLEESLGTFRRYLEQACRLQDPDALFCLADMHYKGTDGASFDYGKALELYEQAGKLKHADALCSAAAMYFHGHGTSVDMHKSFLLYQDAAILGSIGALRNLASMYYNGHGVPKSIQTAEYFVKMIDEHETEEMEQTMAKAKQSVTTEKAPDMGVRHKPLARLQR